MKDLLQNDGHLVIVQLIMDNSDYKNSADKFGYTPLIFAAYRGKAYICQKIM